MPGKAKRTPRFSSPKREPRSWSKEASNKFQPTIAAQLLPQPVLLNPSPGPQKPCNYIRAGSSVFMFKFKHCDNMG